MPKPCSLVSVLAMVAAMSGATTAGAAPPTLFPADKATGVNPDTHLVLTFSGTPTIGKSGQVRIYDAADGRLVDTLDLSIPAGPTASAAGRGVPAGRTAPGSAPAARGPAATYTPTPYPYTPGKRLTNANTVPGTPSGVALPTSRDYQLTIIGGFTDGFHFYPIIVHDHTATIYPHNNLLDYRKRYYVQIDPGVLTVDDGSFNGIAGTDGWTFQTKTAPPPEHAPRLVVAADGSGDFNTVQGALDFIPDQTPERTTVFIRDGNYEEIVYFRNKTNITLLGEDRDKVNVFYNNNEVFNPHPANVLTNEWPGTFPSRRAAFMADHCTGIELVNLTVQTTAYGQAEGLLVVGGKNIVSHVNIRGSGDALQINDSIYIENSRITGDGDSILGRGPGFFRNCELHSRGPFMWIRNTAANHGWIFDHCQFIGETTGGRGAASTAPAGPREGPVLARAPSNGGRSYPDIEVVLLDCSLSNIAAAAWGPLGGDTSRMHLWEFNSTTDGRPIDAGKRHPASRQLTMPQDAETIASYRNPTFVLGGWTPTMMPRLLRSPASAVSAKAGADLVLWAQVAAVPEPSYQWSRNGVPLAGETRASLSLNGISAKDAGTYTVTATNSAGSVTSPPAAVSVN